MLRKPGRDECEEYYFTYIDRVDDVGVLDTLERQREEVSRLFGALSAEQQAYRYAPGKWTPKEVLGHLIDSERVFVFRAFTFARRDAGPLPSMEQDDYAAVAPFQDRELGAIVAEYRAVRDASLALFRSFGDEEWGRSGTASGFSFTVRAFPYIVAGHEVHHAEVLRERYGIRAVSVPRNRSG